MAKIKYMLGFWGAVAIIGLVVALALPSLSLAATIAVAAMCVSFGLVPIVLFADISTIRAVAPSIAVGVIITLMGLGLHFLYFYLFLLIFN